MKLAFYLMTYKGYHVLNEYLKNFDSNTIEVVFVAKDRSISNDYYKEIFELCNSYNIKCFDRTIKYDVISDFSFAIGWRWIINTNSKLIVLHDSLLPRYRGFAPLVNSLINGENKIGVTALIATDKFDNGDIVAQKSIDILYPLKIYNAIQMISPLYYELIEEIATKFFNGILINYVRQNEKIASYSLWRDDDDYFIDWKKSSEYIKRFVDAVGFPYKGARTKLNDEEVIVYDVEIVDDIKIENRDIGKVIFIENNFPIVVCGDGLLKLVKIVSKSTNKDLLPLKKFRSRFH